MTDILIRSHAENSPIVESVTHKIINIRVIVLTPSKIYYLILLGKVLLFIVIDGCEQKNSLLLLVETPLRIGN